MLVKQGKIYHAVLRLDGKKVWRTTGETDKREAKRVHDKIKAMFDRERRDRRMTRLLGPNWSDKPGLPISKIWERFEEIKPDYAPRTKSAYLSFISWLRKRHSECVDAGDITRRIAADYLRKKCEGKTPKTYNNTKSSLSTVWKALAIDDIDNIWIVIPNRSIDSQPYRPLNEDEVQLVLSNSNGPWRDMAIVAILTGLRAKDIAKLRWDQYHNDHLELLPAKTKRYKRAVYIWLHDEVKTVIEKNRNDSEYVFPKIAKQYGSGTYNKRLREMFTGIESETNAGKASFHSLRATFISRCKKAGIPVEIIQGVVGQRSPQLTERYANDVEKSKIVTSLQGLEDART